MFSLRSKRAELLRGIGRAGAIILHIGRASKLPSSSFQSPKRDASWDGCEGEALRNGQTKMEIGEIVEL